MPQQSPNVGTGGNNPNPAENPEGPEQKNRYREVKKECARKWRDRRRAVKLNHPLIKSIPKFVVKARALGIMPGIDYDKINQLLDDMDVEEYLKKNPT